MFHTLPYVFLFFFSLVMGSLITMMSNQWIFLWVGLEINLLSIVPLMLSSQDMNESESSIKYFLIQAVGGAIILMSAISYSYSSISFMSPSISILFMICGLLIKLGVAPFHFWFPQVMNGLNWPMCILLSTWQKLPPIMILLFLVSSQFHFSILFLGILSIWIGGLGGLNQTQLRPLLAYSSISHLGWILCLTSLSCPLTISYLFIYIFSSLSIMSLFMFSSNSLNSILPGVMSSSGNMFKASSMLLLLNLGGIPPLLGFFPKLIAIYALIDMKLMFMSFIMVMGSMISLFYYLSILFNMFLSPSNNYYKSNTLPSHLMFIIMSMILIPLPVMLMMI